MGGQAAALLGWFPFSWLLTDSVPDGSCRPEPPLMKSPPVEQTGLGTSKIERVFIT